MYHQVSNSNEQQRQHNDKAEGKYASSKLSKVDSLHACKQPGLPECGLCRCVYVYVCVLYVIVLQCTLDWAHIHPHTDAGHLHRNLYSQWKNDNTNRDKDNEEKKQRRTTNDNQHQK